MPTDQKPLTPLTMSAEEEAEWVELYLENCSPSYPGPRIYRELCAERAVHAETREQLSEMKAANRELRSLNVKPGISLGYVSELREIAGDLAAALWIQHGPGIDCMWCNRYNDQHDNPCKAKAALAKAKAAGISPLDRATQTKSV